MKLLFVLSFALMTTCSVDAQLIDSIVELTTAVKNVDNTLNMIANLLTKGLETRQTDQCYKGMASLDTPLRTLVTIPGNITALCDTATDGGGWIVFQRRSDGNEDFYRDWSDYKFGFGDIAGGGDYWLGNEILHQLTWRRAFELRVDMDYQGQKYYAQYSSFYLGDEATKYTLHVGGYSGDADDNLSYHNNKKFTTYDMDNDENSANCAVAAHGAWWYVSCYYSNLNGAWGVTDVTGVNWRHEVKNGLSFTEMKIRLTG